jgi:DNA-binding NarL/FixJ family response regulator
MRLRRWLVQAVNGCPFDAADAINEFSAKLLAHARIGKTIMITNFSPCPSVILRQELTVRETEVMDRLAEGLLYKEIADRLGISYSAVHKHQQKIYEKLRVSNRTEAVIKWLGLQRG